MEDLHDLAVVAERRNVEDPPWREEAISFNELVLRIKKTAFQVSGYYLVLPENPLITR
ncbi:MAG: hypothetical protein QME74_00545 [Candidatus Edwardsbacteria bacterium]|nr:hypothetical protein [Candidatus Edwardsbacteria bacterium]